MCSTKSGQGTLVTPQTHRSGLVEQLKTGSQWRLSQIFLKSIYIYIYKQRPHMGVYEVLPNGTLILHLAFFYIFH